MKLKNALKNNKTKTTNSLKIFQGAMNKKVQEGLHYEYLGDNVFKLSSDDPTKEKMQFKVVLPDEIKKMNLEQKDIPKIIFRSQKKVLLKDVKFFINDKQIDSNSMLVSIFKEINLDKGKYYLLPRKFDESIPISITMNKGEYQFITTRVALPDLNHRLYESNYNGIFKLTALVDDLNGMTKFTFNYDIREAKNVDDLIDQKDMILDFIDSNGIYIDKISAMKFSDAELNDLKEIFDFYKMIYDVKKITKLDELNNIKITDNIKMVDYINVQKLYISFVSNKFYYLPEKYTNISLTFNRNMGQEKDFFQNDIYITAYRKINLEILDFNSRFVEQYAFKKIHLDKLIEENEKQYEFDMSVLDDQFQYSKIYLDEPKSEPDSNLFEDLKNAKKVEY